MLKSMGHWTLRRHQIFWHHRLHVLRPHKAGDKKTTFIMMLVLTLTEEDTSWRPLHWTLRIRILIQTGHRYPDHGRLFKSSAI